VKVNKKEKVKQKNTNKIKQVKIKKTKLKITQQKKAKEVKRIEKVSSDDCNVNVHVD
jgi:hypothetical protein